MGAACSGAMTGFGFLAAGGVFPAAPICLGAEAACFDFVLVAGFFDGFFLAANRFAAFFAVLAVFLVARLPVFARFFGVDGLVACFDLPACLRPFFLATFFLAFATTISFYRSNQIVGG